MEKTLVVLAAGMGSRFGGLKQIEPVGPNGEIIADYSVYDAIKFGFTKVVFVIKRENLEYFKEHITKKYEDKIKVEFAFQSLEGLPNIPATREKMLGTAHALLCAKDYVNEPFIMINLDDFYGQESFLLAASFLDNSKDDYEYLSVNYPFMVTSSKIGKVNRGLPIIDSNGLITDIEECSIEEVDNKVYATSKNTGEVKEIPRDMPVSMNFLVFKPTIFQFLERDLGLFLASTVNDSNELILTDVLKKCIHNKEITYKGITTTAKWFGVTYREDLPELQNTLKEMINDGKYPEKLWED